MWQYHLLCFLVDDRRSSDIWVWINFLYDSGGLDTTKFSSTPWMCWGSQKTIGQGCWHWDKKWGRGNLRNSIIWGIDKWFWECATREKYSLLLCNWLWQYWQSMSVSLSQFFVIKKFLDIGNTGNLLHHTSIMSWISYCNKAAFHLGNPHWENLPNNVFNSRINLLLNYLPINQGRRSLMLQKLEIPFVVFIDGQQIIIWYLCVWNPLYDSERTHTPDISSSCRTCGHCGSITDKGCWHRGEEQCKINARNSVVWEIHE